MTAVARRLQLSLRRRYKVLVLLAPCFLRPLRPLSPYINNNNGPQTEENGGGETGRKGRVFVDVGPVRRGLKGGGTR